jgi:hypothetical protein
VGLSSISNHQRAIVVMVIAKQQLPIFDGDGFEKVVATRRPL